MAVVTALRQRFLAESLQRVGHWVFMRGVFNVDTGLYDPAAKRRLPYAWAIGLGTLLTFYLPNFLTLPR